MLPVKNIGHHWRCSTTSRQPNSHNHLSFTYLNTYTLEPFFLVAGKKRIFIMRDRARDFDFLSWYFRRSQPVPTEQLVERIRNRDWEGARQRAVTHPWDARYRTCSGSNSTALHLVCVYRAPPDVVQVVLDAHPEAIMATDGEGWTPLHVAFLYGADERTALLLIKRGGALVAAMQSRLVGSPLHVACRHGVSTRVLQELLQTNPKMATICNESGTKAGTLLWYEYAKNPSNELVIQDFLMNRPVDVKDPGVAKLMHRIQILLDATTGRDMKDSSDPISIHEVVAYQSKLGLGSVIPLAVRLYPDQLSTRDTNGNLPLHIAVSMPMERTRQRFGRFQEVNAVDALLQSYPQAASIANGDGRLALHLALRYGRRNWNTGIEKLVDAEPRALTTRDVETHFYPVQLAAVSCSGNDDYNDNDDNLESLTTVYQLLLAWPPVLQYSSNRA